MSLNTITSFCNAVTQHQIYLSSNSTIQCEVKDVGWSDYAAPQPGAIITVGSEDDIAKLSALPTVSTSLSSSNLVAMAGQRLSIC